MLHWRLREAAKRIGVAQRTLSRFETGQSQPVRGTVALIKAAYEAAGVEFIDDAKPGVRLLKAKS